MLGASLWEDLVRAVAFSVVSAFTVCGAPTATAEPPEMIRWLMPEFLVGDVPGQGQVHQELAGPMADYLISQWPGARHEIVNANVRRSWRMIEAGEHACYLMTLRTPEREAKAYFSDTFLVPPLKLIVRKDKADRVPINSAGEVDFRRLLKEGVLRGVLVKDRSYGHSLDDELAQQHDNQALVFSPPSDFGGRHLQLLVRGLADEASHVSAELREVAGWDGV